MNDTKTHGGARHGAGRKTTGKKVKPLTIRCYPETIQKFQALAEDKKLTYREVLEGLLV